MRERARESKGGSQREGEFQSVLLLIHVQGIVRLRGVGVGPRGEQAGGCESERDHVTAGEDGGPVLVSKSAIETR